MALWASGEACAELPQLFRKEEFAFELLFSRTDLGWRRLVLELRLARSGAAAG